MKTYKDLRAWRESYQLTLLIYRLTGGFPQEERFGLTSQMRRASVSIPSNLAEGYRRRHTQERRHFFQIAFGSASELETQLMLTKDLELSPAESFSKAEEALDQTLRLINGLCESLR